MGGGGWVIIITFFFLVRNLALLSGSLLGPFLGRGLGV